jgi:NhaP-type Na+/H+ or K+/H+ antiporter
MNTSLILLVFAVTLVAGVLQSGLFKRTVLSNSLLFLVVGFVVGILGWIKIQPDTTGLAGAVEVTLVSVLFTDSMQLDFRKLRQAWGLPRRALLLGMPLTFFLIAGLALLFFQMPVAEALLVAAVLSPTDPALASDLLERDEVPLRVRQLLNVESGLNDGLALPVILILVRIIGNEQLELVHLALELVGGIAIGIGIPWLIHNLAHTNWFSIEDAYYPAYVFSVGALVAALAHFAGANTFLAAFFAGVTVSSLDARARDAFQEFGKFISELLKLGALFIFGALLTPSLFLNSNLILYVFACLVLVITRPAAIFIALWDTGLTLLEKITAAWFGPKAFSSLLYGLLIWQIGISHVFPTFSVIALTLVLSILAHSSTSFLFARQFRKHESKTAAQ